MDELIIKEREFKEKLVQVINESGLPAFTIKHILKEMVEQVSVLEQQQYEIACANRDKTKSKEEENNV